MTDIDVLNSNVKSLSGTAVQINHELKRLRTRTTTDRIFFLLVVLSLMGLILVVIISIQELRRDRQASVSANSGVACIIEMLEEHRFAQREAHTAQANHEGYIYNIPNELAAPSQIDIQALKDRLAKTCSKIIEQGR